MPDPHDCEIDPDFEMFWMDALVDDRWFDLISEEYDDICKARGIPAYEKNESVRKEAEEEVKENARKAYGRIVSILNEVCKRGKIYVYRAMTVDDVDGFVASLKERGKSVFEGHYRGVGVAWTWSKDSANAYLGRGGQENVILVAIIDDSFIDYHETINNYMLYSQDYCGATYGEGCSFKEEKEITLDEHKKIYLKEILVGKIGSVKRTIPMNTMVWT